MPNRNLPTLEYNGYVLTPYEDVEPEENIKIIHDVRKPDGTEVVMDWSPYSMPTQEQFALWVELGCPDRFALRNAGGPLDEHDLMELNTKKRTEEGQ